MNDIFHKFSRSLEAMGYLLNTYITLKIGSVLSGEVLTFTAIGAIQHTSLGC